MSLSEAAARRYPALFGAIPEDERALVREVLDASSALWSHEMWSYVNPLLDAKDRTGAMLDRVALLRRFLRSYCIHAGEYHIALYDRLIEQLTEFCYRDDPAKMLVLARVLMDMIDAFTIRRWTDAAVDAPGARYGIVVDVGRGIQRTEIGWQPFTLYPYGLACRLITGMFHIRRHAARLLRDHVRVTAGGWDILHVTYGPSVVFTPLQIMDNQPDDITTDRSADRWMLEYPTHEHIGRARARMQAIHRVLPVQAADARALLATVCRRTARESEWYSYTRSVRPEYIQPFLPHVRLPEAVPWPASESLINEPGPWESAFNVSEVNSYIPVNSDDGVHRWVTVPHARALLAERELLRRYIVVAEGPLRMHAFALSNHERLGNGAPASCLPAEVLPDIGAMLRPTFKSFLADMTNTLTDGEDSDWAS